MKHRVSLRQVEGFLLAANLLSFTRAAEAMHVTQSAFSQLIRELESSLSVRLFDRTTRRVHLTAAGEAMLTKMKRGLEALDDACDEAQAIARVERGHIRVGTLSSLAIGVVTRTLGRMSREVPGIRVAMREDFNSLLLDQLVAGETDLAVCAQSDPRPGLGFEHLFDDELMAVARQGMALARNESVDWKTLGREPLVLTAKLTSTREHVAAALTRNGIVPPAEYEVASYPTSLAMVRAGLGVTFVSKVALKELDTRGLSIVRIRRAPVRKLGIFRRNDRTPSPASAKFAELLRIEVAETLRA